MVRAYWPAGLPEPQLGTAFETAQGRITSDGDVATRERITDPNYKQTTSATWLMSEPEFQVFKSWHFHIIHDGAAWFDVDWCDQPALARFVGGYSSSQSGLHRSVTAQMEIDYAVSL